MSAATAIGRAFLWSVCTLVFGLIPLWISLLMPQVDHDIVFFEIEFLRNGGIIIFAVTVTMSVLVDHYLSRFRFTPSGALMFNLLFPFAICLAGLAIHITTVIAKTESLGVSFVFRANLALAVFAVLFCLIQKTLQVAAEPRR
jgi:hypothetical protein